MKKGAQSSLFFIADLLPRDDARQYIAGLILLGAAPCTAMVLVWSQMTKGDPAYTPVQVSVNDPVMIAAFAPIVALLVGVTDIVVPWETLALSVALYVVIPLLAGALTRRRLIAVHGLSIPCNWYHERTRSNMVASSEIWECV